MLISGDRFRACSPFKLFDELGRCGVDDAWFGSESESEWILAWSKEVMSVLFMTLGVP